MTGSFHSARDNWVHATANLQSGVALHYVRVTPAESNGKTLVLIHGYPQTWYAWRHVMQPFADLGYDVIAPDYRGAGDSSKPGNGYDKHTMGADIHSLYHDVLHIDKAIVVGHDIGSMVAFSLGADFARDVHALVIMEAPHPGTNAYERSITDPSHTFPVFFHFFFHNALDLPESLTMGKERLYIKHFYDRLCYNPAFYTVEDLDHYTSSFESAGAMRAGFEVYRAFSQDHERMKAKLDGMVKLSLPILATGGEHSIMTEWIEDSARQLSDNVTVKSITRSGHWCAEENPAELVQVVQDFLKSTLLLG